MINSTPDCGQEFCGKAILLYPYVGLKMLSLGELLRRVNIRDEEVREYLDNLYNEIGRLLDYDKAEEDGSFYCCTRCGEVHYSSTRNVGTWNKSNMDYNTGVTAGNAKSLTFYSTKDLKCPAGHTKSFCVGWNQTACSSQGRGGDYTCVNPDKPKGVKNCPNDRGYKG